MLNSAEAYEIASTRDERDPRFIAAVWFLVREGRDLKDPLAAKRVKHLTSQVGNYIGKVESRSSKASDIRRGLLRWIHLSPGSTAGEVVRLLRWEIGPLDRKATVKEAEALFKWAAGVNLYLTIDNAIARRYHFRACVLSEALGTAQPPLRYIPKITHKNYNGVYTAAVISVAGSFVEEEVLAEMGAEYGMLPRPLKWPHVAELAGRFPPGTSLAHP